MKIFSLRKCLIYLVVLAAIFASAINASSKESRSQENLRGAVFCFPAKNVAKIIKRLEAVEETRRAVVNVNIDPRFLIKDEGDWAQSFYLAKDGQAQTYMPFSRKDGRVPSFVESVKSAPDTDICVEDPSRAHYPKGYEGLYFQMGLSPLFNNASGVHDLDSLKQGMKDAKHFYKKMIPAAMRMFMPDTDYLAVEYEDETLNTADKDALIFAQKNGEEIMLETEWYDEMFVVPFKALEDLDAEALIIRGGAYDLQPVPSPKFMRRLNKEQIADSDTKPEDPDAAETLDP